MDRRISSTENVKRKGQSGGLSLVTQIEAWVDQTTTRVTRFLHDFRGRLRLTIAPERQCTQQVFNNLGEVVETTGHDGASASSPPVAGTLIEKSQSFTDNRGQVYQTKTFAVDPSTGSVGPALTGERWYDPAGSLIKSSGEGDGDVYTRYERDNLGRDTVSLRGYADAAAPGGELVVSRTELAYDAVSNLLQTTVRERDIDTPVAAPTFRTSYNAYWHDGVGRSIATAAYGTNGGMPFTRSAAVPSRNDIVLVTTTAYNSASDTFSSTDPAGVETRQVADTMGRTTDKIENYQASGSGADVNATTELTYTPDSQIKTLTVKMPGVGNDQVTHYIFGVSPATGSYLTVNNLLLATQYPEDTPTQREEYAYNGQSDRIRLKDQNGTVHDYDRDGLGRQVEDRVTTVGTGISAAVRRIATTFDIRGVQQSLKCFDNPSVGSGTVLNEVQMEYNDFRQLSNLYLAHDGMVNGSTSPKTSYAYASGAGTSNHIRPTSVTYPSGRQIDIGYGGSGGLDDKLNRVRALSDGVTPLVEYGYLGGGTPVQVGYPDPDILLDLWGGTPGVYSGLDRFGRIVDLPWVQAPAGAASKLVHLQYGYNRASSPVYARDEVARTASAGFDQLYSYDGLQRLIDFQQGTLNPGNSSLSSATLEQDWLLDPVGNWDGFNQDVAGVLNQTRTHNRVNEITGISNASGQPVWIEPAYDDAGNTTLLPQPDAPTTGFTLVYDAWNFPVEVTTSGGSPKAVAKYGYNGLRHRIRKEVYDASGALATTVLYFSNLGWQCLESRETPVIGSSATTTYVWGLRYIDDLVCRDSGGTRLYAMQDRQYKTLAIADASGAVQERYGYTPYGVTSIYAAGYTPRSTSNYAWTCLYTGRELDPETGLYYFRNRYYDASLGRFITRDPIGYEGGGLNLMEYAESSPRANQDPLGLWAATLAGTRIKGSLGCVPVPVSFGALSVCAVYDVNVTVDFCECRRICVVSQGTIEVGVFGTGTVGPHFPKWPPKVRPWQAPLGGGRVPWVAPNFPFVHGVRDKCPPSGCTGAVCVTASVGIGGWLGGATVGCRFCYYPSSDTSSWYCGTNVGAGSGISFGGGFSCKKCF